jgi:hypothetical protein
VQKRPFYCVGKLTHFFGSKGSRARISPLRPALSLNQNTQRPRDQRVLGRQSATTGTAAAKSWKRLRDGDGASSR